MRILFFGDSITQGFWGIDGGWVERLRKHYDSISIKDLNDIQPEVFNLGISGDTTRSLLARIEAETQVRKQKDVLLVVVVAIGTNDDLFESGRQWTPPDEFRNNLQKIVHILKPLADSIILVGNPACDETKTTPVSWGNFCYTNRELQRSERVIGEIAKENELVYIPMFDGFKARLDAGENLLADGLHPNDRGHQFMVNCIREKLQVELDRYAPKK